MICRRVIYRGQVQGVGFRWTVQRIAGHHRVAGYVRNQADGSVELMALGEAAEVGALLADVQQRMADYIRSAESEDLPPSACDRQSGFEIR